MMFQNVRGGRMGTPGTPPAARKLTCFAACVLTALAGSTLAQSNTRPARPAPQGQPADDAVLRGPRITDNSHPGERNSFGGSKQRGAASQRPITQPVFMKAVMSLNADGAADQTRVSDDQLAQIKSIEEELRASQRAFAQQHRDEIRELTSRLPQEERGRFRELLAGQGAGPDDRRGGNAVKGKPAGQKPRPNAKPAPSDEMKPPADSADQPATEPMRDAMNEAPADKMDPPAKPDQAQLDQVRDRLRALMEQAPKLEQARGRMWAVLSEPQRTAVEAELVKVRQEMQARQIEDSKKKKASGNNADSPKDNPPAKRPRPDGKRPGAGSNDTGPGTGKPPVAIDDSQIRAKARERLKDLSPEQREAAIKKIKDRRGAAPGQDKAGKDKAGKPNAKRKPPANGQKPPPPIDELDLPKPDDK